MPALLDILKDPNYINANEATKRAIFDRWAPSDPNYTKANEATQAAIQQRFGLIDFAPAEQPPEEQRPGALTAGFKSYLPQLQETFGGVKTLLGVGAERALGEGEISRGLIESGARSMKEAEEARAPLVTPERGSFTDALDKGVGAVLTEWLPFQVGSGAAQLLEALTLAGAGAVAGSVVGTPGVGTATGAVTGVVARELAKKGVKEAAEKILKERGEDAAKEFFEQEAKKAAIDIGKKRGVNVALAGQAGFYGAGQTTSRAVEEAERLGGTATDIELARVLPAAAVSAAAEFIGDKILLGAVKDLAPGKAGKSAKLDLAKNILLGIVSTGTKEVPVEVIQSAAERYGAKLSLDDAKAIKEYVDAAAASYAMSVVPGGVRGVRTTMAEQAAKRDEIEIAEIERLKAENEKKRRLLFGEEEPEVEPTAPEAPPALPEVEAPVGPEAPPVEVEPPPVEPTPVAPPLAEAPPAEQPTVETPTAEPPKVLTAQMLEEIGVKPTAAIVRRLDGLPLDAPEVASELTRYAKRYASPEVRGNIFGFLNTIKAEPSAAPPVAEAAPLVSETPPATPAAPTTPAELAPPTAEPTPPAPVQPSAGNVLPLTPALQGLGKGQLELYNFADAIEQAKKPITGYDYETVVDRKEIDDRVSTPESLMRDLTGNRNSLKNIDGKIRSGNRTSATYRTLIDAWVTTSQVQNRIDQSKRENPELWKAYEERQRKLQDLEVGDEVETFDGERAVIDAKFGQNWRIAFPKGGRGRLEGEKTLVPPSALRPLEPSVAEDRELVAPAAPSADKQKAPDIDRAWRDLSGRNKFIDFDNPPDFDISGDNDYFVLSKTKGDQYVSLAVGEQTTDEGDKVFSSSLEVGGKGFPKGTGIATTMYIEALNIAKNLNRGWMSEGVRSDESRAIYERLKEAGVPFVEKGNSSFIDADSLKSVDLQSVAENLALKKPARAEPAVAVAEPVPAAEAPAAPAKLAKAAKPSKARTQDEADQISRTDREDQQLTAQDIQSSEAVLGDTRAPEGSYYDRTIVGSEVNRKLGADKILTPEQAAQATAYLYRSAVERFDGIVTDENGKPLAVVGGFKGSVSQASVYPATIVAEAVRVPGAAHIWFSHNHPSGSSALSRADRLINESLSDALRGSGIKPMGLLAIAGKRFTFISTKSEPEITGTIEDPSSSTTVPVIERELKQESASGLSVNTPQKAKSIAVQFHERGGDGIIMLNAQNEVIAWVPATDAMRGILRDTGGLNAIYRAISESNAVSAILVHDGSFDEKGKFARSDIKVGQNIGAALKKLDVRVLDTIDVRDQSSAAERAEESAAGPLYSLEEAKSQRNNFFNELRQLLNKFGLKDVALKIEQDMQEAGTYARELIRIADRADNPIRTLRHEAIHALRELGFFTDAQWKSLSKMAKDKWIDQYLKQRNVDGKPLKAGEESRYDAYMREYDGDMEKITEEAVADAFADFDATKPPAGLLQTLLRRLRDFFQAMKSALTKVESVDQIFGKVEKGELKRGEKGGAGERKSLGGKRSTQEIARIFGQMVKRAEKELSSALFNWNDSRLNEDKDKIVLYPGRDRIFARGKEGGKSNVSKAEFIDWLMSDGPFDTSVYGKDITRDVQWRDEIETLRSIVETPDVRKSIAGIRAKAAKAKEDIIAAGREAGQKRKLDKGAFEGVNEDLFEKLKPVFAPRNVTIQDRIIGMRDNFWQRVAQGMADQFRTIKEYSYDAYMKARLSKSIDGGVEGLMFYGQVFNDGGALNIKKNTRGMFDILKPVGKELDRYLIYIALSRDAALPEGKRSIDPDLVARRGELIEGTLNGKPRKEIYEQVRKDMNLLNRSVLKVAVDSGLLNTTEGAIKDIEANENLTDEQKREKIEELRKNPIGYERFINDLNYIPFYKIMEDGDTDSVAKAVSASGLTSQYFSKALKGGEKPFGDLMENTLKNWSHILSASMKNQAAVAAMDAAVKAGVAVPNLKPQYDFVDGKVVFRKNGEVVGDGSIRADMTESEKGAVKIVVDGKNTYYNVSDPLLMDSITSIGFLGTQSKFLDVARDFKNLLQYGVTISPQFRVNNLIRDAVGAMGVSELRLNPVANVLQGVSLSDRNSPTYIAAMAGGGIFNFGAAYEGDQSKMIKRLLKMGVDRDHILDSDSKIANGLKYAWEKYQEWGNKAENANRLALYQQLREKGMSHLEATFKARDLMDFSMQGSWPAFRVLTQVIPFLNARVQGLYKLGRDGISPTARVINNTITGKPIEASDKQKAQQFSIVLMGVTLASALLYLTFKDDEEYKRRDDWDKDNFWWFRVPGMEFALRVPKPFEIGAFGTVVERTLEQILDSGAEGKEFGDALFRMLTNTFAINPIPQVFKPLVDIYANKDSFTGAPIESAGLERLSKQERMVDTTSPLAIALGKVSSLFPETFEISPVQADYLIKGYLGWLGGTIAATSTYATMPFREGEYPDARWMDRLSLGLARELPGRGAKFVTAFYESNKEIAQAYADMRHYAAIGDSEKVQELLEEKGDKIRLAKFYDNVATQMANIRKQIRLTQNDKLMDGAAKKEAIDRMQDMIAMLAKQAEDIRKQQKGGRP